MAKGELTINSIPLPLDGMRYSQGYIDFELKERTIDQTLVSDFIAFKRIFNISWSNPLDGSFMADIIDLYLLKEDVTLYEVQADLTTKSFVCALTIGSNFLREMYARNYAFSGFSISLEEV